MHNIDLTSDHHSDEYEVPPDELGAELESEWSPEHELGGEAGEAELAAELLSVGSEAELESFLGKLIGGAGRDGAPPVKPATGRALGGIFKKAVGHLLPGLGRLAGNLVLPGVGGLIGGPIASAAGHALGLELEGLSSEEQEMETARAFVRFAEDAAHEAAQADDAAVPPEQVATRAAAAAAERHAPGFLAGGAARSGPPARAGRQGRWVRRGNRIVLFGV